MARRVVEGKGEIAIEWRKSSYSSPTGDNCVEVGPAEAYIGVRDTKNRAAGTLAVRRSSWASFASAVASGRFARGIRHR